MKYTQIAGIAKRAMQDITDKQDTSSVNALSALSTLAGTGLLAGANNSQLARTAGGAMAGAGITGAAGYHAARLFGASRAAKLLAYIVAATTGGIAGGVVTNQNLYKEGPIQVSLTSPVIAQLRDRFTGGTPHIAVGGNVHVSNDPYSSFSVKSTSK